MKPGRDINISLLPQSLAEIVEVIGLGPALKLVERYGGRRVCVPAKLIDRHELIGVVGRRAAEILVRTYRLERIHVPKAAKAIAAARDQEIRSRKTKQSVASIAEEFGLTERQVYSIFSGGEVING